MENNRVKYSVDNVNINKFYQMPKFLFECEEFSGLSNDAKVLYMLLKDRHELSLSNGWIDNNGFVYLIYTRLDMQEIMHVSNKTITKIVNELKKYNLIEETRQGLKKPNLIYLLAVTIEKSLTCKNYTSGSVKSTSLEVKKVHSINTNNNNTYFNNQSIYQDEISLTTDEIDEIDYEKVIAENIDLKNLKTTCPTEIVEEVFDIIVDILYSSKNTMTISGENIKSDKVKKRILSLNKNHINYVIDCYINIDNLIKNPRAYLITCLYNAPTTINSYYINQANQIAEKIRQAGNS